MVDEKRKSICLFCSLGCGVAFRMDGQNVTAIDYDKENPVNRGALCPRGHYNLELINHPQRLVEPQIGKRKVSWEEAITFAKQEFKLFDKDSIGIVVSAIASSEDAYMATKLAKAWGIKNISAAAAPADIQAYQGMKWEVPGAQLASLEEIENSDALLIVGDILNRSPVLSKRVNKVKYGKRGNKILVIDPNKTHTSWFATTHLMCRPGTEALVVAAMVKATKGEIDLNPEEIAKVSGIAAEKIVNAAKEFSAASSGTIIFVPNGNKERNDLLGYFIKLLAALSPNKKYITYYLFGNTLGVNLILDRETPEHASYAEIVNKINGGAIKALLVLGEDISGSHAEMEKEFKLLKFVARSDFFTGESPLTFDNMVTLPQASQFDAGGSFMLADGRIEEKTPIVPRAGERSIAEICALLLGERHEGVEARGVLNKGIPAEKADLKDKIAEVKGIVAREEAKIEDVTHFGNNRLARNFLWHRVNN